MNPETLIKLGLSFGAYLGRQKRVLVTNDFSEAADLAKRALAVGLMAGGVETLDGGGVTGRITRTMVQDMGLDGALHLAAESADPNVVSVEYWDARGRWLSKGEQRKIEGILSGKTIPASGRRIWGSMFKWQI